MEFPALCYFSCTFTVITTFVCILLLHKIPLTFFFSKIFCPISLVTVHRGHVPFLHLIAANYIFSKIGILERAVPVNYQTRQKDRQVAIDCLAEICFPCILASFAYFFIRLINFLEGGSLKLWLIVNIGIRKL